MEVGGPIGTSGLGFGGLIMLSGGWNDPKMPLYYTRELAAREPGSGADVEGAVKGHCVNACPWRLFYLLSSDPLLSVLVRFQEQ